MNFNDVLVVLVVANFALGDINMHYPRGSNNRQDENSRNRRNANRLFNSQNNNRGGHNVGSHPGAMYFYAGSEVEIQWAVQHSCGDVNNNCMVVVQYMCDDNLRDGTTTQRAPLTCTDDCDTNEKFGHHESLNYYEACAIRERNKGLFIANRNLKGKDTAIFTRQNNNGARYGYECPEERDYYPYFGPSPWKDIAVFTTNVELCPTFTEHSQNTKSRWTCTFTEDDWDELRGKIFNKNLFNITEPVFRLTEDLCEDPSSSITVEGKTYQPVWVEISAHGIPPPQCTEAQYSRDNHQGNTIGGEFPNLKWIVPNDVSEHCTLRLRYNISTNDFESWNTDHTSNFDLDNDNFGPPEIYNQYDLSKFGGTLRQQVLRSQYYLRNDPVLDVFGFKRVDGKDIRFRVALDTAQYGRTFQDRSHSFEIRARPADLDGATIHNLNVRGKRGNIVQVYPSTEYDFVPNALNTKLGEYVHIQWTGSDRNPGNNAGQGRAGTDRSNIVELRRRPYAEGVSGSNLTLGTNYPPEEPCDHDLFGADRKQLTRLALSGDFEVGDTPGVTLDDAEPYFDFGLLQTNKEGKHYFFSTRNNAFSNRDQKAQVVTTA